MVDANTHHGGGGDFNQRSWSLEDEVALGQEHFHVVGSPDEKFPIGHQFSFLRDGSASSRADQREGFETPEAFGPAEASTAAPSHPYHADDASSVGGIRRRFGAVALTILTICPVLVVASMGFLTFLWFSNHQNPVWRYIVANDHLITVVAGFSKIIEASLQFSVGTSCAMLAALLLEGFHLVLRDAAELSVARLSIVGAPLFAMLWKQLKGRGPPGTRNWTLLMLSALTTLMLIFSQTITVILNTDIGLFPLEGFQGSDQVSYGFHVEVPDPNTAPIDFIQYHGTTWSKKPAMFPTFAEYSSPPVNQPGVVDTGTTLRAFLPYSSQQDRQTLQSYSGHTTVVDTRVTCQVPELQDVTIGLTSRDSLSLTINGGISASQHTPRLMNDTLQWGGPSDQTLLTGQPIPITCTVPLGNDSSLLRGIPGGWRSSLCQLPDGGTNTTMFTGGLVSEFQSLNPFNLSDVNVSEESFNWGVAYMFLNVTEGSPYNWNGALGGSTNLSGFTPNAFQNRNEWRDYIFSNGDLVVSATVCYASFMTADLPVEIQSTSNRTEPTATFDFTDKSYIFPSVRAQMGQRQNGQNGAPSLADRGVLSLMPQRSSWLANSTQELPPYEPYIRDFANMKGPSREGNDGNYSAVLWDQLDMVNTDGTGGGSSDEPSQGSQYFSPDPFYAYFYQDIVTNGGSVAFALQSMYTVMAGMAYYDQFPQFDASNVAARTDFVAVNMPLRITGFVVVAAAVMLHLVILALIAIQFAVRCHHSYLGDPWAMIAQTFSPATVNVMDRFGNITSNPNENGLKRHSIANTRAGLGVPDGASRPGITLVSGDDQQLNRRVTRKWEA